MYEDNFNIDEAEFERGGGIQSKLPKANDFKSSKHQISSSSK